jgi:hypothetical protein
MRASIGEAGIAAERVVQLPGGSWADSTARGGAAGIRVVLRAWRLIGCTRFGSKGLLGET